MKEYVVGIITNAEEDKALFIRKNRPDWQVGGLNGVGGHIEPSETPYEAMVRECKEECNLDLLNWLLLGSITDREDYIVYYFYAKVQGFVDVKSLTDERVEVLSLTTFDYSQLVPPTDVFLRLSLNPRFKAVAMEAR